MISVIYRASGAGGFPLCNRKAGGNNAEAIVNIILKAELPSAHHADRVERDMETLSPWPPIALLDDRIDRTSVVGRNPVEAMSAVVESRKPKLPSILGLDRRTVDALWRLKSHSNSTVGPTTYNNGLILSASSEKDQRDQPLFHAPRQGPDQSRRQKYKYSVPGISLRLIGTCRRNYT